MHLDARQFLQQIAAFFQLDPVILDILPRGEMAVIAVIFARDVRQHPHLAAVERAVRNGNAQHIGVQLQIEAVHQPQRLELVLGHFARKATLHLIAEIGNAGIDDRLIIIVIFIHIRSPSRQPTDRRVLMSGQDAPSGQAHGRGL